MDTAGTAPVAGNQHLVVCRRAGILGSEDSAWHVADRLGILLRKSEGSAKGKQKPLFSQGEGWQQKMKGKRWTVVLVVASFLLSLSGCGKKHVPDGTGMVNDQPWRGFTLSRSDSYAQYNFWFTVQRNDLGCLLTGECRDENGEVYVLESENGIQLSAEDMQYLRSLWLGELPDVAAEEKEEEVILLDAPDITFVLTWLDHTRQEKILPSDVSIEIYEHFLPYFKSNSLTY